MPGRPIFQPHRRPGINDATAPARYRRVGGDGHGSLNGSIGNSEDLTTVDGADSHEKWIIDGSIELGPGILVTAGIFAFDLDSEGTAVENAAGLGGVDNHGWGAIAGVKLSF